MTLGIEETGGPVRGNGKRGKTLDDRRTEHPEALPRETIEVRIADVLSQPEEVIGKARVLAEKLRRLDVDRDDGVRSEALRQIVDPTDEALIILGKGARDKRLLVAEALQQGCRRHTDVFGKIREREPGRTGSRH